MTLISADATEEMLELPWGDVEMLKAGSGNPLLVLHHDIGNPGWLPFYDQLAQSFTVYVPSHPGFGKSDRPDWARTVRDLASLYVWLLEELGLRPLDVCGLGFGGWIAAEMATMDHGGFRRQVLVGAAGLQPTEGEILDQFLVSSTEYVQSGFSEASKCESIYGAEPDIDQLEVWEINREMTTRVAWKPYMFNQSLPHLIPGIKTPTLLVWGKDDRIVPLSCARRYLEGLPNARLEVMEGSGHFVEMERPDELAKTIIGFLTD
ncbi:MAG: alpha/beta hydrolase [Dehalococcoidia bacterium]